MVAGVGQGLEVRLHGAAGDLLIDGEDGPALGMGTSVAENDFPSSRPEPLAARTFFTQSVSPRAETR